MVDQRQSAWRERKKAELRANIVRNALDLFGRRGYDAVSLEEIVEASACSRSTFHRYFGTKEDLLFPGVEQHTSAFGQELAAVELGADPWIAARQAATSALHGFAVALDPDLRVGFARLWLDGAAPRRRYQEIVMEWEALLVAHFARALGPDSEDSLECQLLASLVSSALRAALNHSVATGDDVDAAAERAFDLVESSPLVTQLRTTAPIALDTRPAPLEQENTA